MNDAEYYTPPPLVPCPPPEKLSWPTSCPDELKALVESAEIEYLEAKEVSGDVSDYESQGGSEKKECRLMFDGFTVVISTYVWGQGGLSGGDINVGYHSFKENKVLVNFCFGETEEEEEEDEEDEQGENSQLLGSDKKTRKLFGLRGGTASEILAALLSRTMPSDRFVGIDCPFIYWDAEKKAEMPIYVGALRLLCTPVGDAGRDGIVIFMEQKKEEENCIRCTGRLHMIVQNETTLLSIIKQYSDTMGIPLDAFRSENIFCQYTRRQIEGDDRSVKGMGLREGSVIEIWKKTG